MNYDAYRNRRVAALYYGLFDELPDGLSSWAISDLDAFFGNLDVWCPPDTTPVQAFFSSPVIGLRQHLANTRYPNVGAAGKRLDEIAEELKIAYLERGYDVMEINGLDMGYIPSKQDGQVRITWD